MIMVGTADGVLVETGITLLQKECQINLRRHGCVYFIIVISISVNNTQAIMAIMTNGGGKGGDGGHGGNAKGNHSCNKDQG
jgi:hypothetical protein